MRIILAALTALLWAAPAVAEVALDSPNGTRFRIDDTGTGALVGPGAFASWPRLCVRVCADCDGDCAGGDIYNAGGAAGAAELNGRQLALANDTLAGLTVRRKVFVPNAGGARANGFTRYLDMLTNNTGAAITVAVRVGTVANASGRLGVDGLTVWRTTSDDAEVTPVDRWIVTDDGNPAGGAAAVGYLLHGAGARALPARSGQNFPTAGDDQALAWEFREVRVDPGRTVSFLSVVVHEPVRANAIDEVDNLLRVRDADVLFGLTADERRSIYNFDVTPGNGAALADAGGPYNANEGQQIQLSAAGSFDPEGLALIYQWDFDGDGEFDDAAGINAFHTIPDDGVVNVSLQVTDAAGKIDVDTARIVVVNVDPQVGGVDTDSPIVEGSRLNVDVQVSDPGADPLTFDFDWDGDGIFDEIGVEQNRWDHLYPDDGVFTGRVRVNDDDGGEGQRDFQIVVTNAAPTVFNVAVPPLVAEGADFEILVSARDPGDDVVTYRYDLNNDGVDDEVGVDLDRITTSFPDDGLFPVTVTVCDDQGACSEPRVQPVNIGNVAPVIVEVTSDGPVAEGDPVTVTVVATDAGGEGDPLTYSFDWNNDGEFNVLDAPEPTQQHVFAQQGRYFVGVQVRDDDNGRAVGNIEIIVQNVAPSAELLGPPAGAEGEDLTFECAADDPGDDDLSYDWDLDGDGQYEIFASGPEQTARFGQEGNYTVRCRVLDGDGGEATDQADVFITNVVPTLELDAASPQNEGAEVVVRATAEDPGADELTYTFDFDDDGTPEIVGAEGQGAEIGRHVYGDQGLYTIRVEVFDGTDTIDATIEMDVRNVEPSVRLTTNSPVDEGSDLVLTVEVSDPGDDTISLEWDIDGDGQPDVNGEAEGDQVEQIVIPVDDARFNVTVWATDEDGGQSEQTVPVVIRNVPPSFPEFQLPPAQEGRPYRGTVPADDPAGLADPLSFELVNPPGRIDIDEATGQILWVPNYEDVLNQPIQLTVRVDDGDGGVAETDIEMAVIFLDDDGDGMPDSYERITCDPDQPDVCLDPTRADANEDPDGDGRSNITEWQEDTDPFFFDGPDAPDLQSPVNAGRIPTLTPALVVSWVDNPIGGPVEIEYEIYSDEALQTLVVTSEAVPQAEDEGVSTSWVPLDGLLFEDQWYWWRARALTGGAASEWADPFSFRTNASNEPPSAPTLVEPTNEAVVDTRTPRFRAMPSTDVDEDQITYRFNIFDPARTVNGTGEVGPDGVVFESAQALSENAVIEWQVIAVDSAGGMTASARWSFRVDSENTAPSAPAFMDPMPIENQVPVVESLSPTFVVGGSVDEDGEDLFYIIGIREQDGAVIEESDPLPSAGGQAQWAATVELEENGDYLAYARAVDARGTESSTTDLAIFVSAVDEPPPTPEPQSPNDGVTLAAADAVTIWSRVSDPERREPIVYLLEYCNTANICTTVESDQLSFTFVDIAEPGETYRWSVAARDPAGNVSAGSPPRVFAIARSASAVGGCDCDTTDSAPAPWTMVLLGAGLLVLRRRRR